MADKAISELVAAQIITATDMFVLEQNGTAKKLTGQVLLNWLTAAADGHGGIQSFEKKGTDGLIDTYCVTLADTTKFEFSVANGRSISSVEQTSASGLTRTYTIFFNDGTSEAFDVKDGRSIIGIEKTATSGLIDTYTVSLNDGTSETLTITNGEKGDKGDNTYVWIKYASQEPTEESHSFGDLPDAWIGIYFGGQEEAPTDWQQYIWYNIKGEKGDVGDPATLVSSSVTYQVGETGTIIPSGAWTESIPVVAQGKYLWTKIVQQFNTGLPITSYAVSRMGIDGLGSVAAVAGVSPDERGNVPLTAENVKALPIGGGDMEGPVNMNGQTLSGLNPPTADDHAANMGFVKQQVKNAAPRNLLDNSDFRNPVNQRGLSEYSNTNYTIDRWKWTYAVSTRKCIINEEGLYLENLSASTGYFAQYFEAPLTNPPYTIAVRVNGVTYAHTVHTLGNENLLNLPSCSIYIQEDGTTLCFAVNSGSTVSGIEWIAVYEGEYTDDTLPLYQPKGYGAELSECRRYFRSYQGALFPGVVHGVAGTTFATVVGFEEMRAVPTVTECVVSWIQAGGKLVNSDISATMASATRMNLTFTTAMDTRHGGCAYFDRLSVSSDL